MKRHLILLSLLAAASMHAQTPRYTYAETLRYTQAENNSDTEGETQRRSRVARHRYTRAETAWIHFLDPVPNEQGPTVVNGTIYLTEGQKAGGPQIQALVADDLQRQLAGYPSQPVTAVDVIFYDTPGGQKSSRGNSRSGNTRSVSRGGKTLAGLKEALTERFGVENVTCSDVPEDWETITQVTAETSGIRLKQAALDIMNNVSLSQGRERQLMALANGDTWRQLYQQVFPRVWRIEYRATLSAKPVPDSSIATLESLYATAQSRKAETIDYYDIIDLAARLFPESVEAAVNAAGVALLRGDVKRAAGYLRPLHKDSRANLHLGVMYLLQGDLNSSEVYLRLADAQGMLEAPGVLRALRAE